LNLSHNNIIYMPNAELLKITNEYINIIY
jgi:hypothetical protein